MPVREIREGRSDRIGPFSVDRDHEYKGDQYVRTEIIVSLDPNVWYANDEFVLLEELARVLGDFKEIKVITAQYSFIRFTFTKKSYRKNVMQYLTRALILAKMKKQ